MAIKVRYTYTDYKHFPGATQASRIHSLSGSMIFFVALIVFGLLFALSDSITISIGVTVAFCVLCIAVLRGRYDPDIINGIFLGINGVTKEQRKVLVNHFMHGKKFGKGDIPSACIVATLLKNLDLDYRNKRITFGEYCEQRHDTLSCYGIEDTNGL